MCIKLHLGFRVVTGKASFNPLLPRGTGWDRTWGSQGGGSPTINLCSPDPECGWVKQGESPGGTAGDFPLAGVKLGLRIGLWGLGFDVGVFVS